MKLSNLFKKRKTTSKSNKQKNKKNKSGGDKRKKSDEKSDSNLKSKMAKEGTRKKRPIFKTKRERRREKANRDRNFDMFRGMFGDRDQKTKQGLVNAFGVIIATIAIILGILLSISGLGSRQEYLRTNTTPLGEELSFSNSETQLKFGGAWTDKKRDVTVIKLLYGKKAREVLSTKGKNYKLYIVDNEHKVQNKVKMSYGILGTRGDGYLIIDGKLDKKAYQIVMTNQLHLNVGDEVGSSPSGSRTESEKLASDGDKLTQSELEESLSGTESSDVEDNGRINFEKNSKKPAVDYIDFRVNSYSEKTKVINGSFRKSDGTVDYSKLLDETTVNRKVKEIDSSIKKKETEIKQYKISVDEFKDRVDENKDADDAKDNIESLKKKIDENKETLKKLKKLKKQYVNKDFDKSSFGDMQEKFKVIHTEK